MLVLMFVACGGTGDARVDTPTEDSGLRLLEDGSTGEADAGLVEPGEDAQTSTEQDAGVSPPPPPPPPPGTTDMCGDTRTSALVYYGTPEPTLLSLDANQIVAIGTTGGCSGTFVTDEWVLTARHCGLSPGDEFCVGTAASNPNVCFRMDRVETHSGLDIALAHVSTPASSRMPNLEPIPVLVEELSNAWVGRMAEAAGYGRQENGTGGEREFTAEVIDAVGVPSLTINGMGMRGVCFGDSGGPVMVMASDGSVRVAGVLSWGDPSCVGRDRYTRVDLALSWIESLTGPTPEPGNGCRSLTSEGRCLSGMAIWCEGEERQSESCPGACGWDTAAQGYRCISGTDPCMGVDGVGSCRDDLTARWCDRGALRERRCGDCDQICGLSAEGTYCVDPPTGHNEPCDVMGTAGTCRHLSLCDGTSTPGHCPGPTEIQCCT